MSPARGTHLATLLGLGVSVIPKRAKPQGDHEIIPFSSSGQSPILRCCVPLALFDGETDRFALVE